MIRDHRSLKSPVLTIVPPPSSAASCGPQRLPPLPRRPPRCCRSPRAAQPLHLAPPPRSRNAVPPPLPPLAAPRRPPARSAPTLHARCDPASQNCRGCPASTSLADSAQAFIREDLAGLVQEGVWRWSALAEKFALCNVARARRLGSSQHW
ncbi:hypothetical protein GQ55_5G098000 [Panicum hallii var. hallii]|uniref:Uncharacterized protein n=1 Tax=Panicum hallii var. hallii TaxID=1504633 RepID=A0A2T7DEQ0_9POAL|nr:hypothetical protein GQ55_5G098000 [Panicum hallii var. hallii]